MPVPWTRSQALRGFVEATAPCEGDCLQVVGLLEARVQLDGLRVGLEFSGHLREGESLRQNHPRSGFAGTVVGDLPRQSHDLGAPPRHTRPLAELIPYEVEAGIFDCQFRSDFPCLIQTARTPQHSRKNGAGSTLGGETANRTLQGRDRFLGAPCFLEVFRLHSPSQFPIRVQLDGAPDRRDGFDALAPQPVDLGEVAPGSGQEGETLRRFARKAQGFFPVAGVESLRCEDGPRLPKIGPRLPHLAELLKEFGRIDHGVGGRAVGMEHVAVENLADHFSTHEVKNLPLRPGIPLKVHEFIDGPSVIDVEFDGGAQMPGRFLVPSSLAQE